MLRRDLERTREIVLALVLGEVSTDQVHEYHARLARSEDEFHVLRTQQRRKDGTLVPVEVTHRLLRNQAQAMVVAVSRDISDSLKNEEALRRSEAG